jgi:hypothetical protein
VTTFKEMIFYYEYLRLLELYPVRGTHLGGTPLLIRAVHLPFSDGSYSPQCRFSTEFMQEQLTYTVDALRYNDTHIWCKTPSISESFNEYLESQRDAYVTVNDLDG